MHQLKNTIYPVITVPVFAVLYAYTAVVVLLLLVLSYMKWKSAIYTIMGIWARSVFPIMGKRLHIHGKKLLDKKKKYILLANHASMFDIIAIMAFFPKVSWFGHERLLKVPLFGKLLRMTDYIPMTMANIQNTRRMVEQLIEKSSTRSIAIFPEGTRTLSGKINPFYRGFIYLLRASETDILPVTLNGFFRLKPKNRRHINFDAKLELVIHQPIAGRELIPLNDKEIIEKVMTVIKSASTET
ncbi:MAG: lysophospholipid acyltransferase family protein [Bacteroidales bacterium]|nr:lysophospholipid acyltransferase family protein [Bacteroidales bacterium]